METVILLAKLQIPFFVMVVVIRYGIGARWELMEKEVRKASAENKAEVTALLLNARKGNVGCFNGAGGFKDQAKSR